ncbi:PREDICTED: amiloride-sensitive amine oxidase [copper-containing] [Thamnophis sirtalis]|uniref:Amine oxidase n=1 Tax=Thamnophis sirtalis TaxID=35019 RepID=A0A6I9X5N7_9SAUR|nr:PREDICTED: amiloride-sensitive amine oxidase [copper-containing] [Thamnophis sirtalis]
MRMPVAYMVGMLCLFVQAIQGTLPPLSQKAASIFSDLSPAELRAVRTFLMSRPELGLQPSKGGSLAKNSLFLIEMLPPKKSQALCYLNTGTEPPRRRARAVVFFGTGAKPNITEYIVGPLPVPRFYRPSGQPVAFITRPMTQLEYKLVFNKLTELLAPLNQFLKDVSGFGLRDCQDRCLTFTDIAPRGLASGERRTWIILQRAIEGFFLHPVGLEVLINHGELDPARWSIETVWYNGQYFGTPQELAQQYAQGKVPIVQLVSHPDQTLFSSFVPRGEFNTGPPTNVHGAKVCEPQGHRYSVHGNLVEYSGWSLAFRLRTSTGLQLFDVRFNGERIAYEVSVQEAIAFYGGNSPATMQTKYIDVGWGMGSVTHELAPGIDCPETATFMDVYHHYDADAPVRYPNAICIFELPTGVPLRRHFDSNFQGGSTFYAGLEGHALVIRTTSTVYNYDYIWDFLLFPNGVLETKVHATGYVHTSFYTPEGIPYGTRLHTHLLGNIHTHLVHYKIDLDVSRQAPVCPYRGVLPEIHHWREGIGIFRHRCFIWTGGAGSPRPHLELEAGHPLGRYHLAVTQQHENEGVSSSLYIQNDPWHPSMSFENFLRNDESIDKQDLVAWVTVGFLHIPHSEDIPNTATPGNVVGFLLRPFNFFDEDPSVASRRTVIVRPKESGHGVQIQRWTPESPGHCVTKVPFSYNGTYSPI